MTLLALRPTSGFSHGVPSSEPCRISPGGRTDQDVGRGLANDVPSGHDVSDISNTVVPNYAYLQRFTVAM